jgi:hypothetical protein
MRGVPLRRRSPIKKGNFGKSRVMGSGLVDAQKG